MLRLHSHNHWHKTFISQVLYTYSHLFRWIKWRIKVVLCTWTSLNLAFLLIRQPLITVFFHKPHKGCTFCHNKWPSHSLCSSKQWFHSNRRPNLTCSPRINYLWQIQSSTNIISTVFTISKVQAVFKIWWVSKVSLQILSIKISNHNNHHRP